METAAILFFLCILSYFLGTSFYSAMKILYPVMKTDEYYEETLEKYKAYDKEWYDKLDKKEFYIKSKYGYNIHLIYVKNNTLTQDTIILCHGVTSRTDGTIKYLDMFIKNGYNALFIDHRAHGKTGGKKVSYGYYEKYDLAEAIQWVRKQHTGKIGLIGVSMGAGICMQTLAIEKVDFLIEDCGYSDFKDEVKHQLKRSPLVPLYPSYWLTRMFVYLLAGYDLNKTSPVAALEQTDIPIMVVHGTDDNYVPFYMASIIYDNIKNNNKRFFEAEGTGHATAYEDHPLEYREQVYKFLKHSGMPHSDGFMP